MAVPKKHTTKARRNRKRMHIFLKEPALTACSHCKEMILPHRVCPNCGYYKGKEVLNVLAKLEKKERKQKENEIKEKEKQEQKEQKQRPMNLEELSKKKF